MTMYAIKKRLALILLLVVNEPVIMNLNYYRRLKRAKFDKIFVTSELYLIMGAYAFYDTSDNENIK